MTYRTARPWSERLLITGGIAAIALPLGLLLFGICDVLREGFGQLTWQFLTGYPSRSADKAGVLPALVGTLWLIGLTGLIALPVGVGAAIYLEECSSQGRISRLVEANVANLSAVPPVIYGLLGLGVFVHALGFGRSLIAGACTLALLVLPIVVISAREALRAVPASLREAALALGATRWQAVRQTILPLALPGIVTGTFLAISRAIGATTPLLLVGALTYATFLPDSPRSHFSALPTQIFSWISPPQRAFLANAAAGIIVLLLTMLLLNALAVILRNRLRRRFE